MRTCCGGCWQTSTDSGSGRGQAGSQPGLALSDIASKAAIKQNRRELRSEKNQYLGLPGSGWTGQVSTRGSSCLSSLIHVICLVVIAKTISNSSCILFCGKFIGLPPSVVTPGLSGCYSNCNESLSHCSKYPHVTKK